MTRPGALALLLLVIGVAAVVVDRAKGEPPVSKMHTCHDALIIDGLIVCGAGRAPMLRRMCPGLVLPPPGTVVGPDCGTWLDPDLMQRLALPVDINTAEVAALRTLPGVGRVLAARIEAARPVRSVEGLLDVKGIGPATLRRIAPRVQIVAHSALVGRAETPLAHNGAQP